MTMTDGDDPDEIPLDIMRLAQDVSRAWRRCHRRICKRGRGCRARDAPCLAERVPREPPRNPEKAARDDARAMAMMQRMLRERLDELEGGHQPIPQRKAAFSRRRG